MEPEAGQPFGQRALLADTIDSDKRGAETHLIQVGHLRVNPEAFVGEPVGQFQRSTHVAGIEDTQRDLAEDIQMPRITEALRQGDEARMRQAFREAITVVHDGDLDLVAEFRSRPERHFERRADLPERLVHLRNDQVHQADLRIDVDVHLAEGIIQHRLLAHGVPGSIQAFGRLPAPLGGVVADRDFRDFVGGADELHRLGLVESGALQDLHGAGEALGRDLVVVILHREGREGCRLHRTHVRESGLHQPTGRRLDAGLPQREAVGRRLARRRERRQQRQEDQKPVEHIHILQS